MNHEFCRFELSLIMRDVRQHTTAAQRKAAWAIRVLWGDRVEFHGPDGYYWFGRRCCLWAARAEGWEAWMRSVGVQDYMAEEEDE